MSFILVVLNVIAPGLGCAIRGQLKLALLAATTVLVIIACSMGFSWIDTRDGWLALFALYFLAGALTNFASKPTQCSFKKSLSVISIYFGWLTLLGLVVFYTQTFIAGYSIYLIPSNSMAPTLVPGDIILVRKLKDKEPLGIGEIVIFVSSTDRTLHYVKRTANKPYALRQSSSMQYYLLGDNVDQSFDSRYMGLIDRTRIQHTAKMLLINGANMNRRLMELQTK